MRSTFEPDHKHAECEKNRKDLWRLGDVVERFFEAVEKDPETVAEIAKALREELRMFRVGERRISLL